MLEKYLMQSDQATAEPSVVHQAIDDLIGQLSDDEKRALVVRLQGDLVKAQAHASVAHLPQSEALDQVLEELQAEGVIDPDPREVERRVKAREAVAP